MEEFGWEYHFDAKSGLSIRSAEQFRPELEDALLASSAPSAALVQKTYFYGADKSEYAGVPYSNLAGATFVYRRSGGADALRPPDGQCRSGDRHAQDRPAQRNAAAVIYP